MSIAICPKCGNTDVSWVRDDADFAQYICLECKQVFCYPPKTLFARITASPEVLAEKLVYRTIEIAVNRVTYSCWKSTITEEAYRTKAEAIAATVERLKEVEK
jgi:hypothetical protein